MKTSINITKISLIIFLLVVTKANLLSQENASKSKHRIVFQMTTADTMAHKALMKQISNIKSVSPESELEIVCHGPGLEMLQKNKSVVKNGIIQSVEKGVVFQACEFSLKERKIAKTEILEVAKFVEAGIIHIVSKQEEGWSYIKAGF